MNLSTRSEYGIMAMLDLAKHGGSRPVQSVEIARRQGIPEPYLNQILIILRRARIINSRRGPGGGHTLARDPESTSVGELVSLLEGTPGGANSDADRSFRPYATLIREVCTEAHEAAMQVLNSVTLTDVLRRESQRALRYDI